MTPAELNQISTWDYISSLWPLGLIVLGILADTIVRIFRQ